MSAESKVPPADCLEFSLNTAVQTVTMLRTTTTPNTWNFSLSAYLPQEVADPLNVPQSLPLSGHKQRKGKICFVIDESR